jgi:hypothetical protein
MMYKTYCKNYRACLDALRYFKDRIPEFDPFVKVNKRPDPPLSSLMSAAACAFTLPRIQLSLSL